MKATETVPNAADPARDAAMLEAWRNLSSTDRDLITRAIDKMLSSAGPKAPAFPPGAKEALLEAQKMCEAIEVITIEGISNGVLEFPMLQAVRACCKCMGEAIDPVIERMQAEENHV